MRKQLLSILMVAIMALTMTVPGFAADAPSGWAQQTVMRAIGAGLVPEDLQQNYQGNISRLDFCRMAVRFVETKAQQPIETFLANRKVTLPAAFDDCSELVVLQAAALGITNGQGNNKFNPGASITRQEAATMLFNINNAIDAGRFLVEYGTTYGDFSDRSSMANWALPGITFVLNTRDPGTGSSIMQGTGDKIFSPKGPYTVEQSILTMVRLNDALRYEENGVRVENDTQLTLYSNGAATSNWVTHNDGALLPTANGYDYVVFDKTGVAVFRLKQNLEVSSRLTIPLELEEAVGVHQNEDGEYFVVFTQNNTGESTTKEIFRVVKYSENWARKDSASVQGGTVSTAIPVDAGNLQMADDGTYLTIHTSRERFVSSDGLNHQSNLTLTFDMDDLDLEYSSELFPNNHVSHSFNQKVLYDDGHMVTIDHGDAYPRGIILHVSGPLLTNPKRFTLFKVPGTPGANYTGMTMGDLAQTGTHYMASYNSIHQDKQSSAPYERNAYLVLVPRTNLNESKVTTVQLTNNSQGSDKYASAPQLIRLTNNRVAVLWENYEKQNYITQYVSTQYVVVDAAGKYVGDVQTCNKRINYGYPAIYANGQILAPNIINSAICINTIDLSMFGLSSTIKEDALPEDDSVDETEEASKEESVENKEDTQTENQTKPGNQTENQTEDKGQTQGGDKGVVFTITEPTGVLLVGRDFPVLSSYTGASKSDITYASSDEQVAYVTDDGWVIGVGGGTAKISMTIGSVTKSVTYTVNDRLDDYFGYFISPIEVGKETVVLPSRSSYGGGNAIVDVTSGDSDIVTIEQRGKSFYATGISPGTTELFLTIEVWPAKGNRHPTMSTFTGYMTIPFTVTAN